MFSSGILVWCAGQLFTKKKKKIKLEKFTVKENKINYILL